MSSFVLAFRAVPDVSATQEEIDAWGTWFQGLGGTITDFGGRVPATKVLGASAGANVLSGYAVIEAQDLTAATDVAKGSPALNYGGTVEIGELVSM